MRCWQAAVDEGAAADDATRAVSTLAGAGEALAAVLTRHGLHAQAAHVRALVRPPKVEGAADPEGLSHA